MKITICDGCKEPIPHNQRPFRVQSDRFNDPQAPRRVFLDFHNRACWTDTFQPLDDVQEIDGRILVARVA